MADPISKPEPKTVTEKLEDYFRTSINDKITDRNQARDLIKASWSDKDIDLKRGSRLLSDKAFTHVMKEKGFEIPEGTFKNSPKSSASVGEVVANFAETTKKSILGETTQTQNTENKGFGIFGKTNQTPQSTTPGAPTPDAPATPAPKPLDLADQKKMMRQLFEFQKQMFYEFNLIDGEKTPPKEIPTTFSEKVDVFADNLAAYCYANDIKMPTWIEGFGIALAGLMLFGTPLVMKVMQAKKEAKKEKIKNSGHGLADLIDNKTEVSQTA